MKITRENSRPAEGYDNETMRECPRCHGSGLYMGNPDGLEAYEMDCDVCDGRGVVMLTLTNKKHND